VAETLLAAIAGVVFLVACAFMRPAELHAPAGWYVNGVTPSGRTELRRAPRTACDGARDICADEPDVVLPGRIHCTGGARPIVVNYRTVGCQR
jgi:hypothetical protein